MIVDGKDGLCALVGSLQLSCAYAGMPSGAAWVSTVVNEDPKRRSGVFLEPFTFQGERPMAHVSAALEKAIATAWPNLSHNGYLVRFPGMYDPERHCGTLLGGNEDLIELPVLLGILELEGLTETEEQGIYFGALETDGGAVKVKPAPDDIDTEFRYWSRKDGMTPISAREMPTVEIGLDPNAISKEAQTILREKTPEGIMSALLDSSLLRDGASPADVRAIKSAVSDLLCRQPTTKSLKKSLDMRVRATLV